MKTTLKTLLFALIVGMSTAHAIVINDAGLTTLVERDFSTDTNFFIGACPLLTSFAGLNAPAATNIQIINCKGGRK